MIVKLFTWCTCIAIRLQTNSTAFLRKNKTTNRIEEKSLLLLCVWSMNIRYDIVHIDHLLTSSPKKSSIHWVLFKSNFVLSIYFLWWWWWMTSVFLLLTWSKPINNKFEKKTWIITIKFRGNISLFFLNILSGVRPLNLHVTSYRNCAYTWSDICN